MGTNSLNVAGRKVAREYIRLKSSYKVPSTDRALASSKMSSDGKLCPWDARPPVKCPSYPTSAQTWQPKGAGRWRCFTYTVKSVLCRTPTVLSLGCTDELYTRVPLFNTSQASRYYGASGYSEET